MPVKINDQLAVTIAFAPASETGLTATWAEFPAQHGNSISLIHMTAGSNIKMPTIQIEVTDLLRFFDAYATKNPPGLVDGALIYFLIEDAGDTSGNNLIERYFRVYSWQRTAYAEGYIYVIQGYWDSVLYWQASLFNGIHKSSSEALKEIAETCNLPWDPNNTTTSDTMLWMPHNRVYGDFAKEIASCGYNSDTSHMVLGIDSLGAMRYRDVNANPSPEITLSYLRPEGSDDKRRLIQNFTSKNRAGLYNSLGGYLHLRHVQSLDPALNGSIDSLDYGTALDSEVALRNPDMLDIIDNGLVSYSPVDVKNVGQNYQKGKYQNYNYNLFNMVFGEFLFRYVTDWEVCDNFNYQAPPESDDLTYDGEYTVVSKTIIIEGSNYNEKIVAVRNGLGKKA